MSDKEFLYHLHESSRCKMAGGYNEAILHLSRALEINPKSAAANYELAGLYLQLEDVDKAMSLSKKACKLNPLEPWYKILLGEIYKADGRLQNAADVYGELSRLAPENPEYNLERASLFVHMNKYDAALKEYEVIEKKFGFSENISLSKEDIYLALGENEKAMLEIKKLVDYFPNEPRYLGLLAETYMNQRNYKDAWKYYSKMLEVDSTNGYLHLSLSEYYRQLKDYDKSFSEMKLAFASAEIPVDTKVRMLVAMLTYINASGDVKEQIYSLIQILLETHPDDPQSHAFYADFLINDRQYEQARNELRIVLQSEKKQYLIWEQLLILNSQLNDNNSLLEESKQAMEFFPNQPLIYYFEGLALFSLKREEEALQVLNTGIELVFNNAPLKVQFYSLMAEAYQRQKNNQLSDESMDKALELDPQNLLILNNYSYYLSVRKENLIKAEKMSKITIEADPKNATYLDTYAWVLFQMGKYDKALEYIEQALKSGGLSNAVIVEHYGDILFKTGAEEKALATWEKAINLGKGSDLLERKIAEKKWIE